VLAEQDFDFDEQFPVTARLAQQVHDASGWASPAELLVAISLAFDANYRDGRVAVQPRHIHFVTLMSVRRVETMLAQLRRRGFLKFDTQRHEWYVEPDFTKVEGITPGRVSTLYQTHQPHRNGKAAPRALRRPRTARAARSTTPEICRHAMTISQCPICTRQPARD
jgi:hypothetical protein